MKITWKTFLAVSAYWAGVFGWFYIGIWQVLKKPVHSVILAQIAGHLSVRLLAGALIQGFLYLSLAGGVWCVGYMISEYFRVPSYYKTFQCIADKCEHSCCIGWEIDIDEDSYDYYMGIEGAFGERLKEQTVTEDEEHSFVLRKNGWCPFLDQNKLCDIYSELGEEALCEVCTEYPRFVVEYGDVREKSLSVSCEEVGRIIFSDEGKMSYEDIELPDLGIEDEFYEDEEEEPFEEDMEEFCSHLEEYRTQAVAILQNREKSIDDRIREYLKFCEKLQNVVENPEEELWEPMEYFHVRMETFDELENVNEEWMEVKQRVRDFFETHSYTEALEEYKKSGDYNEIWYEHILVYFTYRYFMRAWYDGNVLAKAQFAIVGFLVIRDMDIVRYFANGKSFKLDDRIANARIFSREVEHSEETLEILEDDISFDEAFHVKHLLGQI